jgi:hypothetical protein
MDMKNEENDSGQCGWAAERNRKMLIADYYFLKVVTGFVS